ncbi:MAG: transposase [bacterium]|nr:transposase [bacterium]
MTDNFNLLAPPEFRGLHPDLPIRMYHRHLPHWRQDGATYAITFRLADSIPQEHVRSLKRWREIWERSHQQPRSEADWDQFAREITNRTEAWLDEGHGECFFRDTTLADEMAKSLVHFQNKRYVTFCHCVMHNHVHLVMKPFDGFELEDILEGLKGFVSRKVNTYLDRKGAIWGQESYDKIIRNEEHLFRVIQYIGRNPAKAGYPPEQWIRWIHPEWNEIGWGFKDE